jgi:copper chaperone
MIAFEVKDMTCGHCVSTIAKAVKAADKDAKVDIDLGKHLVQIQPGSSDARELSDAITDAGYTPMPVSAQPGNASAPGKQRACCRG